MWTNSDVGQARSLVRTMEHLRQVILGVSFFQRDSPTRSIVIAFRNMEEVRAYVPAQFIAHSWSARNMLSQPIIVLSVSSLEDDVRIVTHELTHVISFNVIPDQPAWLAEGLAGYFETARLDERHGKVEVGRPLEFRFQQLRSHGLVPVAQLFACEQPACMDDGFYASTWALTTYLINEHPAELMQYLARLRETPRMEQSKLWAEVAPSLPPEALDLVVAQWVGHGKIKINEYKVLFKDTPSTEKILSDDDVLSARGLLRYLFAPDAVPPEVTQALAVNASAVLPNLIEAAVTRSMDADKAHAVATAHPDDWRSWWLVAIAGGTSGESRDARVKMCALLERTPDALPSDTCSPARLDPAKDPRRAVFHAAIPEINACFALVKGSLSTTPSLEMQIDDSGGVTSATASVGSPDVEACIVKVLRALRFPSGYPGLFRSGAQR